MPWGQGLGRGGIVDSGRYNIVDSGRNLNTLNSGVPLLTAIPGCHEDLVVSLLSNQRLQI